jgi:hypothetical protein
MTLEDFEKALAQPPKTLSGKANSFPVSNGKWITSEAQNMSDEDPLLINPCERDPMTHLECVIDWNPIEKPIWEAETISAVVLPRSAGGEDDPYAMASIGTYGLNRAGLFRERMERLQEMQVVCQPIVDAMQDLVDAKTPEQVDRLRKRLAQYKEKLYGLAKPDHPYSALASAFVARFESELAKL